VARDFGLGVVPHAPQRSVYRYFAHGLVRIAARKDIAPLPGQRVKLSQDRYRLRCERREVFRLCLGHEVAPFGPLEVELRPFRLAKLARANEE